MTIKSFISFSSFLWIHKHFCRVSKTIEIQRTVLPSVHKYYFVKYKGNCKSKNMAYPYYYQHNINPDTKIEFIIRGPNNLPNIFDSYWMQRLKKIPFLLLTAKKRKGGMVVCGSCRFNLTRLEKLNASRRHKLYRWLSLNSIRKLAITMRMPAAMFSFLRVLNNSFSHFTIL